MIKTIPQRKNTTLRGFKRTKAATIVPTKEYMTRPLSNVSVWFGKIVDTMPMIGARESNPIITLWFAIHPSNPKSPSEATNMTSPISNVIERLKSIQLANNIPTMDMMLTSNLNVTEM